MSFEIYRPAHRGRRLPKDCITITSSQIYFGEFQLPFEYVAVEYDTERRAIRFSQGSENDFKLSRNNQGSYFIRAYSFVRSGLLPTGRYKKVDELTYKLDR